MFLFELGHKNISAIIFRRSEVGDCARALNTHKNAKNISMRRVSVFDNSPNGWEF